MKKIKTYEKVSKFANITRYIEIKKDYMLCFIWNYIIIEHSHKY